MSLCDIHDFELSLVAPCLAILERGIRVNDSLRLSMMKALEDETGPLTEQLQEIVTPLLQEATKLPKRHLFREKWTCPCCRGGSSKAAACWSCAGFEKKPTKKMLGDTLLAACQRCDGDGKRETWRFKPSGDEQVRIVLYDVLKLPARTKRNPKGKPMLRVDEDALKDLVAYDKSGVVQRLLRIRKADTMKQILARLAPGDDGRIRTWLNVAGTETGRPSSSETFLEVSTNLLNLPKHEAAKDKMFEVRRVLVPEDGCVFVEADLGGAEAWVTAALSEDRKLIERLRTPGFKIHRWTAAFLFGKAEKDVTETDYYLGKKTRHAGNYGMSWKKFMAEVNAEAAETGVSITAAQAKTLLAKLHALHPGLKNIFWRRVYDRLESQGYLQSIFSFRRQFFGRRSRDKWLDEVHRDAIAWEPQHTVAYLCWRGLLRYWRQHDGKVGDLRLTSYDSILLNVPVPKARVAARLLRNCMVEEIEVNGFKLTIPVEVSVGESWGEMDEVKLREAA